MRRFGIVFAATLALVSPAMAQSMGDMPGMQMPPAQPAHPVHHRAPAHHAAPPAQTATPPAPPAAPDQPATQAPSSAPPDASTENMPGMTMPPASQAEQPTSMDHMQGMESGREMTGALGGYNMNRDASGTSWQADAVSDMPMFMHGDWMLMGHALLNGVYDWQSGPRGDEKAFVSGMIMGMAQRSLSGGTLALHAMLSPDPLMGASGYPLLLQQGETANGVTPLVDRQHPHDLFMELSASYSHPITDEDSLFVYAGLPGEPAFGPPAFMHRLSAGDSPEAPITHHWLDSTHITFGVVTAGWVHEDWKLEVSRFRGREPDQHRYNIETGDLDSTAARVSWNPTGNLSLQVSWADQKSPEQLEPQLDETRYSASAIYTARVGEGGWWSTTLAFGRKERSDGVDTNAWLGEVALHPNQSWTIFARAENLETDELAPGPVRTVSRLSLGAIRDWRLTDHATLGVGALAEHGFTPSALDPLYDGDPEGAMGFVRLKLQ